MKTERIDLGNGDWWDIMGELPWRLHKEIRRSMGEYLTAEESEANTEGQMENGLYMRKDVDPMEIMDKVENLRLLNCSVGWSWEGPITEDTIGERSSHHVMAVIRRMGQLYDVRPQTRAVAETGETEKKGC